MASKQKTHEEKKEHENESFELQSSPGLGSLKKLLGGFCGDRMLEMDTSERSVVEEGDGGNRNRNRNRTTSEDVVRDLNKVLEGNVLSAQRRPPRVHVRDTPPTQKGSKNTKSTETDKDTKQYKAETTTDYNSPPEKEEPVSFEPIIFSHSMDSRWLRTLEAIFVTILSVAVTFLMIQRMVGNVGISFSKRDAHMGGIQIIPTIEMKVVDEVQKLMDAKKVVEDTVYEMHQDVRGGACEGFEEDTCDSFENRRMDTR